MLLHEEPKNTIRKSNASNYGVITLVHFSVYSGDLGIFYTLLSPVNTQTSKRTVAYVFKNPSC